MEVVGAEHPAQGFLLRRGQAKFLGILVVAVVAVGGAVDFIGGVVGVAELLVADVVVGADRGQRVVADVPVQGQRGAVVVELGIFIDVQLDAPAFRALVTDVVVTAQGQRAAAAITLELAAVDLPQCFQVGVEPGQELHAYGFLVDVAVGLVVGQVMGEAIALF
ncbi:hypothetical protein D3C79_808370 [compost metagenome]